VSNLRHPIVTFLANYVHSEARRQSSVKVSSPDHKMQPFRVHKNYICHYSPYFDAAFNGSFIEGETQVLELEDTEPKIFGIFVNWLYTQDIIDEEGRPASCSDCINLWILADKILVPVLQNQTLGQLEVVRISSSKKRFSSAIFHRVWDNTTEDSPLRAYLVEVMIRKPKRGKIAFPGDYPHGMLVAMINRMRSREWDRNLRDGSSQGSWNIPAEELMDYLVSEDVESRKVVPAGPDPPAGNDSGFVDVE
jgi:hypothetical protein